MIEYLAKSGNSNLNLITHELIVVRKFALLSSDQMNPTTLRRWGTLKIIIGRNNKSETEKLQKSRMTNVTIYKKNNGSRYNTFIE